MEGLPARAALLDSRSAGWRQHPVTAARDRWRAILRRATRWQRVAHIEAEADGGLRVSEALRRTSEIVVANPLLFREIDALARNAAFPPVDTNGASGAAAMIAGHW
jgi:hypothetical protein